MYAAVRTVHLAPPNPYPRPPEMPHMAQTLAYWILRRCVVAACVYAVLFVAMVLGTYGQKDEEMEAESAAREAEERDRIAQQGLRREYEVWPAKLGRYGEE